MDPNFGVLLNPQNNPADQCAALRDARSKSLSTNAEIAIVVSVVGAVILGVAAYFLVYKKLRTRWTVMKASESIDMETVHKL